jgi:hypothetical protein
MPVHSNLSSRVKPVAGSSEQLLVLSNSKSAKQARGSVENELGPAHGSYEIRNADSGRF